MENSHLTSELLLPINYYPHKKYWLLCSIILWSIFRRINTSSCFTMEWATMIRFISKTRIYFQEQFRRSAKYKIWLSWKQAEKEDGYGSRSWPVTDQQLEASQMSVLLKMICEKKGPRNGGICHPPVIWTDWNLCTNTKLGITGLAETNTRPSHYFLVKDSLSLQFKKILVMDFLNLVFKIPHIGPYSCFIVTPWHCLKYFDTCRRWICKCESNAKGMIQKESQHLYIT